MEGWLSGWSLAAEALDELRERLYVAKTINTADETAEQGFNTYMEGIYPHYMEANQKLKEKLLASNFQPKGFEIPLMNRNAIPLMTRLLVPKPFNGKAKKKPFFNFARCILNRIAATGKRLSAL